jgi:hypothetical protein
MDASKPEHEQPNKKRYKAPTLTLLGSVRDLTFGASGKTTDGLGGHQGSAR